MERAMTKQELIAESESIHKELINMFKKVPAKEWGKQNVVEKRMFSDVVLHLGIWQQIACSAMIETLAGQRPDIIYDEDGLNRVNYIITQFSVGWSSKEVQQFFISNHETLVRLVGMINDEVFESNPRLGLWFEATGVNHPRRHLKKIEDYLQTQKPASPKRTAKKKNNQKS
ncbi:MAG: hypothetical protein C5B54_02025 [Acidobacteria bacterium]|nr:MAG: hypothetical protein C5B54_02025 [Acidobacteriota bacterium]